MTIRKKLPAYGATLRDQRRAGNHPLCVHLIYGNNWRAQLACAVPVAGVHPMIALKPEDYAPEVFDFALVTGVHVAVFDQVGAAWGGDASHPKWGFGRFYDLVGELARFAAEVSLHSVAWGGRPIAAHHVALDVRDYRFRDVPEKNHGWPAWWSAEIEEKNAQRRDTWLDAVVRRAARAEPEVA